MGYQGELVRGAVADMREAREYDRLVGAGTYIFRLSAQRCVDATRAGNMAHLINHSCAPNCHSRLITVDGKVTEPRVVLFALRALVPGEEILYDYRFAGETLPCNCGSFTCRGIVNAPEGHDNDDEAMDEEE